MKKILCMCLAFIFLLTVFSGCSIIQFGNESHNDTHKDTESEFDTQLQTLCDESNSESENELQESPAEDFEYEILNDGTVSITQYIGDESEIIIPKLIEDAYVTKIDIFAFRETNIKTVIMPDTIKEIANEAFRDCSSLEKIKLSNNLISIGSAAFYNCIALKHITIPSTLVDLGELSFCDAGIETIVIEEGLQTITYSSFSGTNIRELVLPKSIKTIGVQAFGGCKYLEHITLNDGLTNVEHLAFGNNPVLKEIIIPQTVEKIDETAFTLCGALEKVMFEGDAPDTYQYTDEVQGVYEVYDVHYTVYFHAGAEGFTLSEWYGYPTKIW